MDCTAPVMRSYVNHFKQAIGSFFDFRYVFGNRLDRACPNWSGAMRHTFFQRSKLKTNKNFTSQPKNTKRNSEFTTKILANLISFHLLGAFFCLNSSVPCDDGSLAYHLKPALRLVSDFWQEKWSQNWTKVPAV